MLDRHAKYVRSNDGRGVERLLDLRILRRQSGVRVDLRQDPSNSDDGLILAPISSSGQDHDGLRRRLRSAGQFPFEARRFWAIYAPFSSSKLTQIAQQNGPVSRSSVARKHQ